MNFDTGLIQIVGMLFIQFNQYYNILLCGQISTT